MQHDQSPPSREGTHRGWPGLTWAVVLIAAGCGSRASTSEPSSERQPTVGITNGAVGNGNGNGNGNSPPGQLKKDFADHRVVVRYSPGAAKKKVLKRAMPNAVARRHYPRLGPIELVELPPGTNLHAALAQLRADSEVAYAEPDYSWSTDDVVPNDPQFGQLWGLSNQGQTGGTPGIDIGASAAWEATVGSAHVVIGVIDTGLDYSHPELTNNVWLNPGEIAGNGIDDDANGHVDDMHGIDTYNDDSDPMDDNLHGTHVAGTIAATGDDGRGVVGVAWRARVAACKFLGANGRGATSDALTCLDYFIALKQRGVNISATNNSWGGGFFSRALQDGIAASEAAGILFIAAAGNAGVDNDAVPYYPASYPNPNIIAVAAIDALGALAPFSNFGASSVDIAAPGVSIYSTTPGGTHAHLNGTSMATPHVSGVVALIAAHEPDLTAAAIKARILASGVVLPSLTGKTATGRMLRASLTPNADSDADHVPDAYELAHGSDPDDPADAALDGDDDQWTLLQEYRQGTDPGAADSDGDGVLDSDELQRGTYPATADSDADGMRDGQEIALGTNPRDEDSDDDFLRDTDELASATDPLVKDSDADGFLDGDEVVLGIDPLDLGAVPTSLALQNASFELGGLSFWTIEQGAGAGAPAQVALFDTDGDGQEEPAARFQAGCDDEDDPLGCPAVSEPTDALVQSFATEGGPVVVSARLAFQYPAASLDGGHVEVYLDGQRVGVVNPGFAAAGAVIRKRLRFAAVLSPGGHELRLRSYRRYEASATTPYQYLDDIELLSPASSPIQCQTLTLFKDDFEGGIDQWSVTGNVSANTSAEFSGQAGADISRTGSMTATFDTSAASNLRLSYRLRVNRYDPGETLTTAWCAQGCGLAQSWHTLDSVSGTTSYASRQLTLPPAVEGRSALALRFSGNATGTGEEAFVDDVAVVYDHCLAAVSPAVDSTAWAVSGQTVAISGAASDPNGDLAKVDVQILDQGVVVAEGTARGTTRYAFSTTLLPGAYVARATATDSLGLRRVSDPIEINVAHGDLFDDDFERADLSQSGFWQTQHAYTASAAARSGARGAVLQGGSGLASMELAISTRDYIDVVLGYARRTSNADLGEDLVVEYSTPERGWQTLERTRSTSYGAVSVALPKGEPELRVRFAFLASQSAEVAHVDDLFIAGVRAQNLAFVTSQTYRPDAIGGLAGADAKCNAAALAGGLPGRYVAWLSDSQNAARDRLGEASGWARLDGYPFARSASELLTGRVMAPVRFDQLGRTSSGIYYFTATAPDGARDASQTTCGDFTVASAQQVALGLSEATTQAWTSGSFGSCSSARGLLCLGVDYSTSIELPEIDGRLGFLGPVVSLSSGLAQADAACQSAADAAGYAGSFSALLASSTASAASRFSLDGPTWTRPDGMPILASATDLALAPPLLAPINVEADGDYVGPFSTLGGASSMNALGALATTCNDWTDLSGATSSRQGIASNANSFAFGAVTGSCAGRRIYCLQQ